MDAGDIGFEVSPLNGSMARLVVARRGDEEIYRDRLDTSRGESRAKLARAIAKLLSMDAAALIARCHAELPRLADLADQATAAQVGEAAAATPSAGQGRELNLSWPTPWPSPVALGDVLDEAVAAIRRHVWVGEHQATAAALWASWTYHVERFDVSPLLVITSPVKRCGKTTLGRVLQQMLPRVLPVSNISPAALYRVVEAARPVLIIDEADTFLSNSEELRGLLNAGHTRDTAYVVRVEGDDHQPRVFGLFGAKMILGIGRLPSTVEDRAIVLTLERRPQGVEIRRLTRKARGEVQQVGQKLMRWALDHADQIDGDVEPATPEGLNDRQADSWAPLLALADLAAGEWPARARAAAVALSAGADADDQELPIRLLSDLRIVFDRDGRVAIPTSDLVDLLSKIEDSPWGTMSRGRPITPHKLSRLLGGFGIRPRHRANGNFYSRADLAPAWGRYCPPTKGPGSDNCSQPHNESFIPSSVNATPYEIRI